MRECAAIPQWSKWNGKSGGRERERRKKDKDVAVTVFYGSLIKSRYRCNTFFAPHSAAVASRDPFIVIIEGFFSRARLFIFRLFSFRIS